MSTGPSRLGKVYAAIMIVVCLGFALAIFDSTRWGALDGRMQSRVVLPIARPSLAEVVALKPRILQEARALWILQREVELDLHCEQHLSNGFAFKEDQSEIFWFLVIKAQYHGHKATWEQRLDNKLPETE